MNTGIPMGNVSLWLMVISIDKIAEDHSVTVNQTKNEHI